MLLYTYITGLLFKDVLTKEMEDYVSGSTGYYTSPSVGGAVGTQYIPDTSSYSYGDPTRIFDNANTIDNNQGNRVTRFDINDFGIAKIVVADFKIHVTYLVLRTRISFLTAS